MCADHNSTDVHVIGSHPYPNGPGNYIMETSYADEA